MKFRSLRPRAFWKPWDWYFRSHYCFEIGQVSWQQRFWEACQIWEWLGNSIYWNHGCHYNPTPTQLIHYNDITMGSVESQITSLTIVNSAVYWDADQTKHQSSASLAFVRGIYRGPVNSPHKWPVTQKMVPFDDVIMYSDVIPWGPMSITTSQITSH